jgi:signal transduction histidine kinase
VPTDAQSTLVRADGDLQAPARDAGPPRAESSMDISAIRVAVLVHDLRNILSVINGSAERIHLHLPPGVAHQELEDFRSAVAQAAVLTGELLVGRPPDLSSPRQVDLNRVIGPAVEVFERLSGDRIRVRVELSDEPALVNAAVIDIERILINLFLDARDAMPDGGLLTMDTALVLDPSDRPTDPRAGPVSRVRLRVRDTGRGMTSDLKARVLQPYVTTKVSGPGSGFHSVAISVAQLGGTLSVERQPGAGTCVSISFPPKRLPH